LIKVLDALLLQRKNKVQSNSVSVVGIIKDVKKNGDKALLKYEKRFNKNNVIVPSANQISKSIKSLDKKVKNAIDLAYTRIHKFHSLQKFKNISYTDKLKNKLGVQICSNRISCNICAWFNGFIPLKCFNECYSSNCCWC
jgi:histidinol dehydrogenase